MKPAPFDYVAPDTIEGALDALAAHAGAATILAGGQTLMPLLALRMSNPSLLVDVNNIEALKGSKSAGDGTHIGAVMRQNELIADTTVGAALPVVVQAARHIGHHQTRNRGTVGGSISLGEPAAELPACAVALGARIHARSKRGARDIAADEFYVGPYVTVLEPDELITGVTFPSWSPKSVSIFREIQRRAGDFALVGLVGAIECEQDKITRAGLAWFGMGPTPMKARKAEAALVGQAVRGLDVKAIAELAIADAEPFDDQHATADYRRSAGRRAMARALPDALKFTR